MSQLNPTDRYDLMTIGTELEEIANELHLEVMLDELCELHSQLVALTTRFEQILKTNLAMEIDE